VKLYRFKNTPKSIYSWERRCRENAFEYRGTLFILLNKGDRFNESCGVFPIWYSGDKVQSYASIRTAQKILGRPSSYITDIQVKLKCVKMHRPRKQLFQKKFMRSSRYTNCQLTIETGSSIRTLISDAVGVTLLIVAGFGIYNILNMMIYEKIILLSFKSDRIFRKRRE
jgi:lipoprotein-releasing system permease protein